MTTTVSALTEEFGELVTPTPITVTQVYTPYKSKDRLRQLAYVVLSLNLIAVLGAIVFEITVIA